MKVREIIQTLQNDGWFLARTRGSHRQFHHPMKSGTVTVAGGARVVVRFDFLAVATALRRRVCVGRTGHGDRAPWLQSKACRQSVPLPARATTCPRKRITVLLNKLVFDKSMDCYVIVLEPSKTGYAAFSPDVPGCVATGKTVEQTLAEMRAAMAFHFEGMSEAGELLPTPKGLEHYVRSGEYVADAGDLLTTIPADELLHVAA